MKRTATSRLAVIIESSEILKEIRRISAAINMDAVNAMLLSRRADKGHRNGFTVVASEMRQFAARLDTTSNLLLSDIQSLVANISSQSKYQRMRNFYHRLSKEQLGSSASLVREILEHAQIADLRLGEEMHRLVTKIITLAQATRRLCHNNAVLYRNARVEVAYLPAYRQELSLVADRIEQAMTDSFHYLSRLLKLMQDLEWE